MWSLTHLELQLVLAKKKRLIESFEHVRNRDSILVKLKPQTTDQQKKLLKEYIQKSYADVMTVTFTPHENALYIRYVS